MINKCLGIMVILLTLVALTSCAKKGKIELLSEQYEICIYPTIKFSYKITRGIDSINVSMSTINGSFNTYIGNNPDTRNYSGSLSNSLSPSITKLYSEYHANMHIFNALYAYKKEMSQDYDNFPIYILFTAHDVSANSPIIGDIHEIGNSLLVCPKNIKSHI